MRQIDARFEQFRALSHLTEGEGVQPPRDAGTVALSVLTLAGALRLLFTASIFALWRCVAHSHIARRSVRFADAGLSSAWFSVAALPHLPLVPFVQKMSWWQSGVAAGCLRWRAASPRASGFTGWRSALCGIRWRGSQ